MNPLITKDPITGSELIVTRLESPTTGMRIEGEFSLGWIGRLTAEQIDFVGLLLRYRTNLQKLAGELGVAYNTVRARLDDIVEALGGNSDGEPNLDPDTKQEVLAALESGEIDFDEAMRRLRQ